LRKVLILGAKDQVTKNVNQESRFPQGIGRREYTDKRA